MPFKNQQDLAWIEHFDSAPFPWLGTEGAPFFDVKGPEGGLLHRATSGELYPPSVYSSDEVLLYLSPPQAPARPWRILLYFHGQLSDLADICQRSKIVEQIRGIGGGVALIAPQLALRARDSHPGRLLEPGSLQRLLAQAAQAIAARHGISLDVLQAAPVTIAAFSGGYRAVVACLRQSDLRVDSVFLLDAVYALPEAFAEWTATRDKVLMVIFSESSALGTEQLRQELLLRGIPVNTALPDRILPGEATLLRVESGHLEIPTQGPPRLPITALLKRLIKAGSESQP